MAWVAAVAQAQSLAAELPHAMGAASPISPPHHPPPQNVAVILVGTSYHIAHRRAMQILSKGLS